MKQDWEIYRDTGILGAYRPEQVILRRSEDGGVETLFRDSAAKWEGPSTGDAGRREVLPCDLRIPRRRIGNTHRQAPAAHRHEVRAGAS